MENYSLMKEFITEELKAVHVGDDSWKITLANGEIIPVIENAKSESGSIWDWRIDTQFFDKDEYALNYLKRLVQEKLTGERIIYHEKKAVPEICGINGAACRCPGACNSMLCTGCPVAEKFFADEDGVELIYAVASKEDNKVDTKRRRLLEKYPELENYDSKDYRCDIYIGYGDINYEVVFEVEGERFYCFLDGCASTLEAMGLFFKDHPNITYSMICDILTDI